MRRPTYKKRRQPSSPQTLIVLLNKPYNTLCQFTGEVGDITLANFIDVKNVYPAGRLDKDSEGLLILTNNGQLQNRISHPKHKQEKVYWAQVEGTIDENTLIQLRKGVLLNDGKTKPAKARQLTSTEVDALIWERQPPIRVRQSIPTSWLELIISEGKNRQVRRMTAAVGLPTLRLVRVAVGPWHLGQLQPGEFQIIEQPL